MDDVSVEVKAEARVFLSALEHFYRHGLVDFYHLVGTHVIRHVRHRRD